MQVIWQMEAEVCAEPWRPHAPGSKAVQHLHQAFCSFQLISQRLLPQLLPGRQHCFHQVAICAAPNSCTSSSLKILLSPLPLNRTVLRVKGARHVSAAGRVQHRDNSLPSAARGASRLPATHPASHFSSLSQALSGLCILLPDGAILIHLTLPDWDCCLKLVNCPGTSLQESQEAAYVQGLHGTICIAEQQGPLTRLIQQLAECR